MEGSGLGSQIPRFSGTGRAVWSVWVTHFTCKHPARCANQTAHLQEFKDAGLLDWDELRLDTITDGQSTMWFAQALGLTLFRPLITLDQSRLLQDHAGSTQKQC